MFESIVDDPIIFENKVEVPNSNIVACAQRIWDMALWIMSSFEEDCASSSLFDENGKVILGEAFVQFCRRNVSRTMSYVSHVMVIEKLLTTAVEELRKDLETSLTKEMRDFINTNLASMTQEVSRVKKHRDKVSAHPAYVDPRSDDTLADLLASLDCWDGSWGFTANNPLTFHIGGMLPVVDGVPANRNHYSICLYDMHQFMMNHFKKWETFLLDLLDKIENLKKH